MGFDGRQMCRITSKQGKQIRNHRCQHVEESFDKAVVQFFISFTVSKFDKSYSIEYDSNMYPFYFPPTNVQFQLFPGNWRRKQTWPSLALILFRWATVCILASTQRLNLSKYIKTWPKATNGMIKRGIMPLAHRTLFHKTVWVDPMEKWPKIDGEHPTPVILPQPSNYDVLPLWSTWISLTY